MESADVSSETRFYRQWICANGWAEALGLGTTFVLGRTLAPTLVRTTGVPSVLLAALLAVLLGTLLEGILVGAAQGRVLRQQLPALRLRSWIRATAIGAGLAWLLGMVPSTVMALASSTDASAAATEEPAALVQYVLAALLGLVAGPILGVAQWAVLRRLVKRAGHWLWANAVAWAVGMALIFIGMDLVPWEGPPVVASLAIYGVCGAAGLTVGAIHGRVLLYLLREPVER